MTQSSNAYSGGPVSPEDEDTIELELTPEQVQALSRAAAASGAASLPVAAMVNPSPLALFPAVQGPFPLTWEPLKGRRERHSSLVMGIAIGIGVAVGSSLLGGVVYMTREAPPAPPKVALAPAPVAASQTPVPPPIEPEPVRFKNPFDPREVFEFPPGTSQAEARDAVAAVLLERARERRR